MTSPRGAHVLGGHRGAGDVPSRPPLDRTRRARAPRACTEVLRHPPGTAASPPGEDAGSGSVLVLAAVVVLGVVLAAGLLVGQAVLASAQASTAADLAALAGARSLAVDASPATACAAVADFAERNGARVTECAPAGTRVRVEVAVDVPGLRHLGAGDARARAHAGPAAATFSPAAPREHPAGGAGAGPERVRAP